MADVSMLDEERSYLERFLSEKLRGYAKDRREFRSGSGYDPFNHSSFVYTQIADLTGVLEEKLLDTRIPEA